MAEIAEGLEFGKDLNAIALDRNTRSYLDEYLKSLSSEPQALPSRHQTIVSSQIRSFNNKPGQLSNLTLFTDFFKVTDQISGIRSSSEIFRLQANNTVIRQLDPITQQPAILQLKQQNAQIIQALLQNFFQAVHTATSGETLSRYNNIGAHLWMWNDSLQKWS